LNKFGAASFSLICKDAINLIFTKMQTKLNLYRENVEVAGIFFFFFWQIFEFFVKGGLISDRISLLLQSPKKVAKTQPRT
jgi:hypothetical protein